MGRDFLPPVNFGASVDTKQICRHTRKGIRDFSCSIRFKEAQS